MDCAARVRSRSAEASPCPLICWSIGTEAHVDAATGWRVNHGLYPAREEEWAGGDTFANLPSDGGLRRPRDIFCKDFTETRSSTTLPPCQKLSLQNYPSTHCGTSFLGACFPPELGGTVGTVALEL